MSEEEVFEQYKPQTLNDFWDWWDKAQSNFKFYDFPQLPNQVAKPFIELIDDLEKRFGIPKSLSLEVAAQLPDVDVEKQIGFLWIEERDGGPYFNFRNESSGPQPLHTVTVRVQEPATVEFITIQLQGNHLIINENQNSTDP